MVDRSYALMTRRPAASSLRPQAAVARSGAGCVRPCCLMAPMALSGARCRAKDEGAAHFSLRRRCAAADRVAGWRSGKPCSRPPRRASRIPGRRRSRGSCRRRIVWRRWTTRWSSSRCSRCWRGALRKRRRSRVPRAERNARTARGGSETHGRPNAQTPEPGHAETHRRKRTDAKNAWIAETREAGDMAPRSRRFSASRYNHQSS